MLKISTNPLRQTDRETKENRQRDMGKRRRTYEVKRTERNKKMKWSEILWVLGVSFSFSFPSSPSFSYGNPSSSSELLGSSINQRLYEIPAGAKGQRRKLAAVFSSPFMLAAGLIAKCAISLISTLKQTPRQAGEELFARSYILWHRILFWEGGGVVGVGGGSSCFLSALSFYTRFLCFHPSHHPQVREGKQWSMLLSHCFVDTFQQRWRSSDDWRPFPLLQSEVVLLINTRPGELWWPFCSHSLCYSPAILLGLPNGWNARILGLDTAFLADNSRRKVSKCAIQWSLLIFFVFQELETKMIFWLLLFSGSACLYSVVFLLLFFFVFWQNYLNSSTV